MATSIYRIAVTGGAGTGKTTVCDRLRERGVSVISADELSRDVVLPGASALNKIFDTFGPRMLKENGTLNRQRLRRLITADKTAKEKLERIMHPEIIRRMHEKITAVEYSGASVVVVEVPLLFELGLEKDFDLIVLVYLMHDVQVKRIMARDNVTRKEAEALLGLQISEEKKRARSDYVIDNNGSLDDLVKGVDRLYAECIKKVEMKSNSLDT